MTHSHDHDHEPTPEDELKMARGALADGDLRHAMTHAANALGDQPQDPETIALVDEVASAHEGDPLELVPLEGGAYFGLVAAHAHLLARAGRYDPAISLICQVTSVRPDRPFFEWVEGWLALPGVVDQVEPQALGQSFERMLAAILGRGLGAEHELLQTRILAIVRLARASHPHDGTLAYVHTLRSRKAGLFEESERVAREVHATRPTYISAIALAGTLREQGKLSEAITAFRDALGFKPNDAHVRLDIGDLSLDSGDLEGALAAYHEALDHDPENSWAKPSACYVRYLITDDACWEQELAELASQGGRALDLADRLTPYLYDLQPPGSSIVSGATETLERGGALTRMGVSGLEPPSARLVVDALRRLSDPNAGPLEVGVAEIPTPDPRQPTGDVAHLLWRYEDTDPFPALPKPDPAVLTHVVGLAASPYKPDTWNSRASAIASKLEEKAGPQLLAAMVHPVVDPIPQGLTAASWVFRQQVASAAIAARMGAGEAWEGSLRQGLLKSILRGPLDWTTLAGILALTNVMAEELHLVGDALPELLAHRVTPPSPIWYMCAGEPLVHLLPRVPGLTAELRDQLRQERAALLKAKAGS